ncbi:hypothetical protein OHB26_28555 [Nocardia sp. NBC_01503]|uniref:hypothetical protein n=1 Tax=Nocardia sp. NBC_01503 TaxID=2975997 RepID=UPI002E7BD88C|nr:hypothetical protein [Nocardia sp. NBC_01503]WTL30853.1 hypothetical protein OHB26_28555 [Nocardia sp. NBC_01503]
MVKPESALRRLLRDTGKLLQPYGFQGDEPTWVRVEAAGVAAVGRTRTFRTFTGGQQILRFGLTMSATPLAWWEFCTWRSTRLGLPPIPFEEATGPGLIPDGLPDTMTEMWSMRLVDQGHIDPADIDTIRAELPRRVHAYARRAIRLLEPGHYLDELLAQPDPHLGTWEAIVVLLADGGPSAQLDEATEQLLRCVAAQDASEYGDDVITYAQSRAALV